MIAFLSGNKTYLLAALGALLTVAHSMDYINTELYSALMGLIGSGGLATLRSGIAKAEAKVETTSTAVSNQVASVAQDTAVVSAQVAEVKDTVIQAAVTPSVIIQPGH